MANQRRGIELCSACRTRHRVLDPGICLERKWNYSRRPFDDTPPHRRESSIRQSSRELERAFDPICSQISFLHPRLFTSRSATLALVSILFQSPSRLQDERDEFSKNFLSKGTFPITRMEMLCPSFLFQPTFLFLGRRECEFFFDRGLVENLNHYSQDAEKRFLKIFFNIRFEFHSYQFINVPSFFESNSNPPPQKPSFAFPILAMREQRFIPYHPRHRLEKHSVRPSISINPDREREGEYIPTPPILVSSPFRGTTLWRPEAMRTHTGRTMWHC